MRLGWFILFSCLLSAQHQTRQISLLVPSRTADSLQAGTTVSLGSRTANFLGPSTNRSPAVVIVDLAVTPIERHACLLLELSSILPELGNIPVYTPISTMRRYLYSVEMANGLHLGILSQEDALHSACQESLRTPEKMVGLDYTLYTMALFQALTARYAQQGPLRIFWLSSDFSLFDWRTATRRPSPIEFTQYPSLVELLAPSFSQGGAVLFPVQAEFPRQSQKLLKSSSASGDYFALETGGFISSTTNIPGQGLKFAISRSESYKPVVLEIPALVPYTAIHPSHIHLDSFSRIFVTNPPPAPPLVESTGIKIARATNDIQISAGCEEMKNEEAWVRIQLPDHVIKSSSRKVLLHFEALRQERRSLRQRMILNLDQPLCVAVQDTYQNQPYLFIAHEEQSGWTAAKTVILRQKSQ